MSSDRWFKTMDMNNELQEVAGHWLEATDEIKMKDQRIAELEKENNTLVSAVLLARDLRELYKIEFECEEKVANQQIKRANEGEKRIVELEANQQDVPTPLLKTLMEGMETHRRTMSEWGLEAQRAYSDVKRILEARKRE